MAITDPDLHSITSITSISIADARASFSDVIGRARHAKSPTVLTSRGRPVAAVVSIEDLELIEEAVDMRLAADARARIRAGEAPIPWDDVKTSLTAAGQSAPRGAQKAAQKAAPMRPPKKAGKRR